MMVEYRRACTDKLLLYLVLAYHYVACEWTDPLIASMTPPLLAILLFVQQLLHGVVVDYSIEYIQLIAKTMDSFGF